IISVDLDENVINISEDNGRRKRPINSLQGSWCHCDYPTHVHRSDTHQIPKSWRAMLRAELQKCVLLTVGRDFADIRDVTSSTGTNAVAGLGAMAPSGCYAEDNDAAEVLLLDTVEEHFDGQQVRIAFLQFFVRICRNYRVFMDYTETRSLEMQFRAQDFLLSFPENERTFVADLLNTEQWDSFIQRRIAKNSTKLCGDVVTFDYCIARTVDSAVDTATGGDPHRQSNGSPVPESNSSIQNGATDILFSPTQRNGPRSSISEKRASKKIIYKSLPSTLFQELKQLQLENPSIKFSPFFVPPADENPTNEELKNGWFRIFVFFSFPMSV
ncbi:hypothetical protein RFI_02538, partial [Reticulomyxa filosa]